MQIKKSRETPLRRLVQNILGGEEVVLFKTKKDVIALEERLIEATEKDFKEFDRKSAMSILAAQSKVFY